MRESRTYGSVRGAHSNVRPYRDLTKICQQYLIGSRIFLDLFSEVCSMFVHSFP
jgi:hypothetical protein